MLLLLITVFLPFVITVADATDSSPQSCTKLKVAKEDKYYGLSDSSTTVSFNLQLFKFGKSVDTWIHLSNVSWYDSNERYPDYICADVSFGINDPDPRQCSSSFDQPFAFYIQDPSFYLHAHFPGYWSEIFFGYADDGTFSYGDGSLFTTATPSYSYNRADKSSSESDTQTCTFFSSAPAATEKTPKCKTFESYTKIINNDLEIYATSNGTFTFINDGKYVNSTMNFDGPEDYFVLYHINGEPCESKYKTCNSEIIKGDQKIIISSSIVKQVETEVKGDGIPMVGRIIVRGDQTLMNEGVPFSPTNNCMDSNYNFGDNHLSLNEFCCTEFESA